VELAHLDNVKPEKPIPGGCRLLQESRRSITPGRAISGDEEFPSILPPELFSAVLRFTIV
jgi:hypothetical protein